MHRDARVFQVHPFNATRFAQCVKTTARGRFRTSLRAAERDWFAGDDAELCVTTHHRDRVHDPRHRLFVGVDVGRGNVAVWSNDRRDLESVAARESFEFGFGKTLRIANHTALAATIRNADSGALPRHPRLERLDFVERDVGMITNAALGWTTRDVVLHAITFKYLHVAAIHLHGNGNDQLPFGIFQNMTH